MVKHLSTRIINMVSLFRERGLAGLRERIMRSVWRTYPYVFVRKSLSAPLEECNDPKVQFRVATEDDVPWICRNMSHQGEKTEKLARQYLQGDDLTVIGALKENPEQLAFFATVTPKDYGMSLLGDVIVPGDACIGRVWVPPEFRSLGFGALGCQYAEFAAQKKGVGNIWAFILVDNVPSRKVFKKMGYEEAGRLNLLTRFGRRYVKIKRNKDSGWWRLRVPIDTSL